MLRLLLIGVFLHERWGLLTIASIYFFITFAENVASACFAYRCLPQLQIRREHLNRQTLKECSSFSAMAFLNAIAYQLTNATDSVVIGFMMGTDKIVPYYIALRLTQFLKQPIDKIVTDLHADGGSVVRVDGTPSIAEIPAASHGNGAAVGGGRLHRCVVLWRRCHPQLDG
ncbi:MAG: oligosaccharide flippase family protein [Microthrixaceae bacterium]